MSTTDALVFSFLRFMTKVAVVRPDYGILSPFRKYGFTFSLFTEDAADDSKDYLDVFELAESLLWPSYFIFNVVPFLCVYTAVAEYSVLSAL